MYNRIIIAGNLTRDPEITTLPDGSYVTKFSLAGNTKFKQPSGDTKTKTETLFIDVQVYGSRAKPCNEYLCKGHPALVEGRLREYTWERDGVKHRRMEIVASHVVFLPGGKRIDHAESDDTAEQAEKLGESEAELSADKGD